MADIRSPGVYFEPAERRVPMLALGETGVPVFVGATRRGPMDRPVRLNSRARFTEVFGEALSAGYLGHAISGFFDNGGHHCFVLRIARVEGDPDEECAEAAERVFNNMEGKPALRLIAQDPGSWANGVSISVRPSTEIRTFLTQSGDAGAREIHVKSSHGIGIGTLLRIHNESHEQWVYARRVNRRHVRLVDPLEHAFDKAAPSYVTAHAFDLVFRDQTNEEVFERLSVLGQSPRFAPRIINVASRLVRCQVLRPRTGPELSRMEPTDGVNLEGGADGLENIGPEDFIGYDRGPDDRRGLMVLQEAEDIDLLCLPDLMSALERSKRFRLRDVEVVQEAAVTLCENHSNCFAILDVPPGGDFEEVLRWRRQFDTARAALYFPWVKVLDGNRRVSVPPCGHLAGIISRSDREVGVHKAPANSVVEGIVDLDVILQDAHLALLNNAGINCIRAFGPRGLRIWGARTMSSDASWRFVNVRRTVSAISAAIERGMQWVVFEPNKASLWKRIVANISIFLSDLWRLGLLTGTSPEQAFFVQCDEETNPKADIAKGRITTQIGVAVARPVEFIIFRVSRRLEDQSQTSEE